MSSATLIRLGGLAALLAGALRAIGSFVPTTIGAVPLELLYLCTDFCLLFGVLGIYAFQHAESGAWGFAGFVLAAAGSASIIGPDGELGGVSMYTVGASVFALGLLLLAVGAWQARKLPRWIPALWVGSTLLGFVGFFAPGLGVLFVVSGVLFGVSYAAAGLQLMKR